MKSIKEKIGELRAGMAYEKVDAYIIPTNGPHNSEYPAEHWAHREWVSGFTGSAGTVVVTSAKAGLWTDARYFQQAERELEGSGIVLFRMGTDGTPDLTAWLISQLKKGARVGMAAEVMMRSDYNSKRKLFKSAGITLITTPDLVARIRADRPKLRKDKIFEHDVMYAGKSRDWKLNKVRKKAKKMGAEALLVTALDEIGWLLNLRGSDVAFNPVFYSYLWVEKRNYVLFIDRDKIETELQIELAKQNIEVVDYSKAGKKIKSLSRGKKVAIDPDLTNMAVYSGLKAKEIIEVSSPAMHLKAIKNDVEIQHLKQVMLKDAVALAKAFHWLDKELETRTVSEYEFGEKLAECRGLQPFYFGESFSPIVGYQSNGAIIHYRADKDDSKMIRKEGVLLVDSGGQYVDGTTDITRTFALGPVTDEQKKQYTLVLKGHIALAAIQFPRGTTGLQLDAITRQFLWKNQLDYGHGTGHGVGFFMNVHEPPQGFAPKFNARGKTPHLPGMYSSNEPGYYETGSHGIRLENLVICVKADEDGKWLKHDTITLYPFDLEFIDRSLLTRDEITWLNSYHERVKAALVPQLGGELADWISHQCRPIE